MKVEVLHQHQQDLTVSLHESLGSSGLILELDEGQALGVAVPVGDEADLLQGPEFPEDLQQLILGGVARQVLHEQLVLLKP